MAASDDTASTISSPGCLASSMARRRAAILLAIPVDVSLCTAMTALISWPRSAASVAAAAAPPPARAGGGEDDHRILRPEYRLEIFEAILGQLGELRTAMVDCRIVDGAQNAVGNISRAGYLQEVPASGAASHVCHCTRADSGACSVGAKENVKRAPRATGLLAVIDGLLLRLPLVGGCSQADNIAVCRQGTALFIERRPQDAGFAALRTNRSEE